MTGWSTTQDTPMNPEIRDQWVAALESGEFNQGQGRLHHIDATGHETHCCLGVLCVLAFRAGVIPAPTLEASAYSQGMEYEYGVKTDVSTAVLPTVVQKWSGLTNQNGSYTADSALSAENDRGASFAEISAIIKENF